MQSKSHEFKSKGNKDQFQHEEAVESCLDKLIGALEAKKIEDVSKSLKEGTPVTIGTIFLSEDHSLEQPPQHTLDSNGPSLEQVLRLVQDNSSEVDVCDNLLPVAKYYSE